MHVYVCAWGTNGLSIPTALPQIVNTAPTQEWSQMTGVGRGGLEGLNWEECPTSIVGKLAFVGARTGCRGMGMGLQGQKTQNSSRGFSRERGREQRGRGPGKGEVVLGGVGGVGTL